MCSENDIIDFPYDPLGDIPCESDVEFVSRHAIAECGLICPRCKKLTADRAEYSKVKVFRIPPNGLLNEGIICRNRYTNRDGVEVVCDAILFASPDTEHGDDLLMDKGVSFADLLTFKRKSAQEALKEKYGFDLDLHENPIRDEIVASKRVIPQATEIIETTKTTNRPKKRRLSPRQVKRNLRRR